MGAHFRRVGPLAELGADGRRAAWTALGDRRGEVSFRPAGVGGRSGIRPQTGQLRAYHRDRQYTVQEGDALAVIAFDHGIPYPWIQQANPGIGDNLQVGQILTIPSPDLLLPLPVREGKRITVSLSSQMMWVYEDGDVQWQWQVSTGMPSSPTSPGVFQIQTHELEAYAANWDLSMPHFMGIYEPGPRADVMNGFHGFPSRGGAQLLWTGSLGRPVTYGCILISSENATTLYEWAEEGTVVEIHP